MGLGVNLYSDKKTIIEKYGVDSCNEKLTHKSDFMNKLSGLKLTDEQIQWFSDSMQVQLAYDECSGVLSINSVANTFISEDGISNVHAEIRSVDSMNQSAGVLLKYWTERHDDDGGLHLMMDGSIELKDQQDQYILEIYVTTQNDEKVLVKRLEFNVSQLNGNNC